MKVNLITAKEIKINSPEFANLDTVVVWNPLTKYLAVKTVSLADLWTRNGDTLYPTTRTDMIKLDNDNMIFRKDTAFIKYHEDGDLFIGWGTPSVPTTNPSNLGIGTGVLRDLTSGDGNLGIGYNALGNNTTGEGNIAIGYYALYREINKDNNIAIGVSSMKTINGNYNIGIGTNSLYSSTNAEANVAIGVNALYTNTTADSIVAIGTGAGEHSTGAKCVYLGNYAGRYNISNNKLYVANNWTRTPLIRGTFPNDSLIINATSTVISDNLQLPAISYESEADSVLGIDKDGNIFAAQSNGILFETVTVSASDINNLSTIKTLLSSPGSEKFIKIYSCDMYVLVRTTLNSNGQNLNLQYITSGEKIGEYAEADIETVTSKSFSSIIVNGTDLKEDEGVGIILSSASNPTSGDVTFYFYITYKIISLPPATP